MIELLCGMLGVVMMLGVFALGFNVGYKFQKPVVPEKETLAPEELERIRKEREQLEQEQAAFRILTGYSADIAYGGFPEEGHN